MNQCLDHIARVRIAGSMRDIDAERWDACANPPGEPYNPFVSHGFLDALERSGSATARTGWLPQHLLLEETGGGLLAAAPCYLKSHSRGEFVFDWGWADAYERAGGRYNPKLQIAVPFTPVTGPRLLSPPGALQSGHRLQLAAGAAELCRTLRASSVHMTFLTEPEASELGASGWLWRTDTQFHWHNQGYSSFADFLAALSSRKRKNIRKERAAVASAGIEFTWVTGSDIRERHWDAFFDFYQDTGSRKWGSPYLTRAFFSMIGETMGERVLLVFARRAGREIAGALNLIGSDALYGRYWGASEHHEFLHFEACYYQAIEFAIARRLERVEAGAQGPHKLARGYLPSLTHSAHHIVDPRLSRAVADYLERERRAIAEDSCWLAEHSPFRRDGEADGF
jgi:predicted N-acyltransferase